MFANRRRYQLQPQSAYPDDGLFNRTVVFGRSLGHGRWMGQQLYTDLDFVNCDISKVDFLSAEFTNVTFTNCNLHATQMTAANLSDVTFTNCDLSDTNFYAAMLDRVHASHHDFASALLEGAFLSDGSPVPQGYTTRRVSPRDLEPNQRSRQQDRLPGSFSRNGDLKAQPPRDAKRGVLTYTILDYDLAALGPHAEFLLKEHPRAGAGKLLAMGRAISSWAA